MSTMTMFMKNGWDPNEYMPPHDPASLAGDLHELLDAWDQGPEKVSGADWIIPPARGKDRLVVGDDYPYKAAFNRPAGKGKLGTKPVSKKQRLEALGARLKEMVQTGDLSKEDAMEPYNSAAGSN